MGARTTFFSVEGDLFRSLQAGGRLPDLVDVLSESRSAVELGLNESALVPSAETVGSLDEFEELISNCRFIGSRGDPAQRQFGREVCRGRARALSARWNTGLVLAFDRRAALLTLESYARLVSAAASATKEASAVRLLRFTYPFPSRRGRQEIGNSTIVAAPSLPACGSCVRSYFIDHYSRGDQAAWPAKRIEQALNDRARLSNSPCGPTDR